MAWWAMYKRINHLCRADYNEMIQAYKKYLYDQWWEGLSQEERDRYTKQWEQEEEERRKKKEADKRRLDRSLAVIGSMYSYMYNRAYPHNYMSDGYGAHDAIQGLRRVIRDL